MHPVHRHINIRAAPSVIDSVGFDERTLIRSLASAMLRLSGAMTEPALEQLNQLIGTWTTEATHPALPGVVVHGTASIEWLEGERFLIHRARTDHSDFPDSISIIGITDRDRVDKSLNSGATAASDARVEMHYFDSRGIFRIYDVSIDDGMWRLWRNVPGFSQRFVGTFADGGETIDGRWELCEDDVNWKDDLQITYRRRG